MVEVVHGCGLDRESDPGIARTAAHDVGPRSDRPRASRRVRPGLPVHEDGHATAAVVIVDDEPGLPIGRPLRVATDVVVASGGNQHRSVIPARRMAAMLTDRAASLQGCVEILPVVGRFACRAVPGWAERHVARPLLNARRPVVLEDAMPAVMSPATRGRLLKDTLGRALRCPSPMGTRTFALDGLSFTVEWRPVPASGQFHLRISVRQGARRMDNVTSVPELSQIPKACEQTLLRFEAAAA